MPLARRAASLALRCSMSEFVSSIKMAMVIKAFFWGQNQAAKWRANETCLERGCA